MRSAGLYACIASGFSLVWGVLNIINILHGSLIVLGGYCAFFAYQYFGISPFLFAPIAGVLAVLAGLCHPAPRDQPGDGPAGADHAGPDLRS